MVERRRKKCKGQIGDMRCYIRQDPAEKEDVMLDVMCDVMTTLFDVYESMKTNGRKG